MAAIRVKIDAALDDRRLPDMSVLADASDFQVGESDEGNQDASSTLADPNSLIATEPWSISMGSFWSGLSAGVEVIEICNGPLCLYVLPTRGMGIWKASYEDIPIGWNAPARQPVHPRNVNLSSRNGLGWLDGFNELLCRCGLAFNGPPGHDEGAKSPIESEITLHGRIANMQAYDVELFTDSETGVIGVSGFVDECTLFGPQLRMKSTISTKIGSATFTVVDEITNIGPETTELSLLYHTNVGEPFLGAGSKFECAASGIIPRDYPASLGIKDWSDCLGPTPGYAEQVYYCQLISDENHQTETLLRNQAGDRGISQKFDTRQMPCYAFWKCTQDERGGYVAGLEPAINYPNFKTFERHHKRIVNLAPGETYVTQIEMTIHDSVESVNSVSERIQARQGSEKPKLYPNPTAPFCPID